MSYNPVTVINALTSVPDLSTTAVAAMTARLFVLESVSAAETAKIATECGLTPGQALALSQTLEGLPPAAAPVAAAASGAPVQVRA